MSNRQKRPQTKRTPAREGLIGINTLHPGKGIGTTDGAGINDFEAFPSIFDLGRRIVALDEEYDRLDMETLALPERRQDNSRRWEIKVARAIISDRADALVNLALGLPARSLRDVSVLLSLGWRQVCRLDDSEWSDFEAERFHRQIRHAFVSSLPVVAAASGITPEDVGIGVGDWIRREHPDCGDGL